MVARTIVVALTLLGMATAPVLPAWAQRREGAAASALVVQLPMAVRFGDASVPAGRYRVSISDSSLVLLTEGGMVAVAAIPCRVSTTPKVVSPARIQLVERGNSVQLTLSSQNERYTATGTRIAAAADAPQIEYAKKSEPTLQAPVPPPTEDEAIATSAVDRLMGGVTHCGEMAHKSRWQTGDPRFVQCVCPITTKWRLPRIDGDVRLHRVLAPGRAGFSITVTADGRARDCAVWVGPLPPEQKRGSGANSGTGAASPSTTAAKPGSAATANTAAADATEGSAKSSGAGAVPASAPSQAAPAEPAAPIPPRGDP
jgi:hypothetical protein